MTTEQIIIIGLTVWVTASEALSLIPSVKANGIFQAVNYGIRLVAYKFGVIKNG